MTASETDLTLCSDEFPVSERCDSSQPEVETNGRTRRTAPHDVHPRAAVGADVDLARSIGPHQRYVERGLLGSGGMGYVVRALDRDLDREVAIKVLNTESRGIPSHLTRFVEEAQITGQLEHPFVVPVYEFGCDDNVGHYLSMKLVRGETLEARLAAAGAERLSPDRLSEFLSVFVKICDAIAFAHSRGIVHRDLKPSNVMLGDFGQVYVLDWGIARRTPAPAIASAEGPDCGTKSGPVSEDQGFESLSGTPCYMAPEQLLGLNDQIDERTDVFGLGAMLYHILTNQSPRGRYQKSRAFASLVMAAIRHPDRIVDDGSVPQELSRIALKAMSLAQSERYASASELKADIERFQRGTWQLPHVRYAAGTVIFREGEEGQEAHIIVKGHCEVFSGTAPNEAKLRDLMPGDVYGETAVFADKPRSASIRAVTDVEVMVVTRDMLTNALGLNLWIGRFVKALADRFREVDERLRRLTQDDDVVSRRT